MAQLNFNAQEHDPASSFEPIPEGWYDVMITGSEMKPVKPPKQGAYLNLELTVQGGNHNGRKLFVRLNLHNENPVAVEIAQKELSAICHVTGVFQVSDSQQLHGVPFKVRVVVRAAEGNYDASNEVKGYRDINGNEPGKTGGGGTAPQQGQPQGMPQQPTQPQGGMPQQPQGQPQGQPQQQWNQQPQPNQQPAQGQPWQQQPQQPVNQQPMQDPNAGQGPWNQGGQPAQQAQQPVENQAPPQQTQQPEQGYVQPPQGGQTQPVQPPQQGDNSGVPPWQRQG